MASSIKLEATCIITHLPHGSMYYIYSFISSTSGVLKYCGPMACKLNICVYAPLILVAGVSVDSAPGLRPRDVKSIELDSHSSICTMFLLGIINAMMSLNQLSHLVLISVITNWPGS